MEEIKYQLKEDGSGRLKAIGTVTKYMRERNNIIKRRKDVGGAKAHPTSFEQQTITISPHHPAPPPPYEGDATFYVPAILRSLSVQHCCARRLWPMGTRNWG